MTLSRSITSRLQFQHETVEELIKGYSEEQLRTRVVHDKWSSFENTAHLVRYQLVFQQRIERILVENIPEFERYAAENDSAFDGYLQQSLQQLLQSLYSVRKQIYQQLQGLTNDQLTMSGRHPKYGNLSLVQWTEFFLLHEAHHLFTMFQLLVKR
jgi:hypothetical protein